MFRDASVPDPSPRGTTADVFGSLLPRLLSLGPLVRIQPGAPMPFSVGHCGTRRLGWHHRAPCPHACGPAARGCLPVPYYLRIVRSQRLVRHRTDTGRRCRRWSRPRRICPLRSRRPRSWRAGQYWSEYCTAPRHRTAFLYLASRARQKVRRRDHRRHRAPGR